MSTPQQKTAPKKEATKKEVELKDGSFLAKKIGANLIATIKGSPDERYARAVSKELGETIMKKMELYNKRPSKAKKEEIIELLTPEAVKAKKEKETVVAKAKGIKQQLKKDIKKSKGKDVVKEQRSLVEQLEAEIQADETAIPKLQAILDKYKKKEEVAPPAPVAAPSRRYKDEYL